MQILFFYYSFFKTTGYKSICTMITATNSQKYSPIQKKTVKNTHIVTLDNAIKSLKPLTATDHEFLYPKIKILLEAITNSVNSKRNSIRNRMAPCMFKSGPEIIIESLNHTFKYYEKEIIRPIAFDLLKNLFLSKFKPENSNSKLLPQQKIIDLFNSELRYFLKCELVFVPNSKNNTYLVSPPETENNLGLIVNTLPSKRKDILLYFGEIKNGNMDGNGIVIYKNGDYYEGEFKNNLREGKGFFKRRNGDSYEGDYKEDNPHGNGQFNRYEQYKYDGDFDNDRFHGKGQLQHIDGTRYKGTFEENQIHGKGLLVNSKGESFDGEFLNGQKDGKGIATLPNGQSFEEFWQNGKLIKHTHLKLVITSPAEEEILPQRDNPEMNIHHRSRYQNLEKQPVTNEFRTETVYGNTGEIVEPGSKKEITLSTPIQNKHTELSPLVMSEQFNQEAHIKIIKFKPDRPSQQHHTQAPAATADYLTTEDLYGNADDAIEPGNKKEITLSTPMQNKHDELSPLVMSEQFNQEAHKKIMKFKTDRPPQQHHTQAPAATDDFLTTEDLYGNADDAIEAGIKKHIKASTPMRHEQAETSPLVMSNIFGSEVHRRFKTTQTSDEYAVSDAHHNVTPMNTNSTPNETSQTFVLEIQNKLNSYLEQSSHHAPIAEEGQIDASDNTPHVSQEYEYHEIHVGNNEEIEEEEENTLINLKHHTPIKTDGRHLLDIRKEPAPNPPKSQHPMFKDCVQKAQSNIKDIRYQYRPSDLQTIYFKPEEEEITFTNSKHNTPIKGAKLYENGSLVRALELEKSPLSIGNVITNVGEKNQATTRSLLKTRHIKAAPVRHPNNNLSN
jgi:hypothetical protein